jgi:hypothetical protein
LGIPAEFRSMHYNEIYTAWVVPRGFSQNYPNNERKKMTKYILQEFGEQNGEFTYHHQYLYEKKSYDKMSELDILNSFFNTLLTEDNKASDGEYWDGNRTVWIGSSKDITAKDYQVLSKYI